MDITQGLAKKSGNQTALTLSRHRGEAIDVDGPCRIVVTRLNSNRCRLTIVADRQTVVTRSELLEK